ncbi:MAG: hypothetical protein ACLS90_07620 [Clostridia bacterium]
MSKRFFISLSIAISVIFSFSICLATDGMTDAPDKMKNTVNKTEEAVKNTMNDAGNAVKDSTRKTEESMNDIGSKMMNNTNNYNATRTSTTGDTTLMGLNATAWTWLILGIAGIAIIAVVWYYSAQLTSENDSNNRD